jgi:hypothetical protein
MINISVQHNFKRVAIKLFELRTDVLEKAKVRALNKVAAQAKVAASKEIRAAGYGIKAAAIKQKITISHASIGQPTVTLRVYKKSIPLIHFSARQTQSGVSVNVKNGRKIIYGAFIATMPTGHKGVFVRVGDKHKKNSKGIRSGLPIKELFGPSIGSAFSNEIVQRALVKLIHEKFPTILEHEIKFAGR